MDVLEYLVAVGIDRYTGIQCLPVFIGALPVGDSAEFHFDSDCLIAYSPQDIQSSSVPAFGTNIHCDVQDIKWGWRLNLGFSKSGRKFSLTIIFAKASTKALWRSALSSAHLLPSSFEKYPCRANAILTAEASRPSGSLTYSPICRPHDRKIS